MIMKIALETMLPVLLQKTTTYRIVHGVIAAIASLQPTAIKFPNTTDEMKTTQLGFYNIARFSLVVGAMEYGLHKGK